VLADKKNGITIDECVGIHRHIENNLDREAEDFELQVSSPGLDHPFTVLEQYYKNEGKKVEVIDNDGAKFTGRLKNITPGGFELETEVKVKGKTKEVQDISLNFDQVKTTKIILTIK
jgi:ribosome maturation factor RimP